MTTYSIFMHYYNTDINKAVTNVTECEWLPADYKEEMSNNLLNKDYIDDTQYGKAFDERRAKDEQALEYLYISKNTTKGSDDTNIYEKLMISGLTVNNPKYDMVFMWDGLGYVTNESYDADNATATLYYDKMKRIRFLPWFFHSTYHSLQAAMNRASQLVNVYGKEHIMIGKEVDLTQYIDIV